MRKLLITVVLFASQFAITPAFTQEPPSQLAIADSMSLRSLHAGDRVRGTITATTTQEALNSYPRLSEDYRIGPGDVLRICVNGRVNLYYGYSVPALQTSTAGTAVEDPRSLTTYVVTPDGYLQLPLINKVEAAGRTVGELKTDITSKLTEFFKKFDVDITVIKPGTIKVVVSGQVANPGPQVLSSCSTVLESVLRADVLSSGSTRRVELIRDGKRRTIDIYGIAALGQVEANVLLQTGDEIFVPAARDRVILTGEVCRSGQFEAVSSNPDGKFHISDLTTLCLGLLPGAEKSRVTIERPSSGGQVEVIHVDLTGKEDPEVKSGDKVVVPGVVDYQASIRLVGEFKGDGVYQRTLGSTLSKSGVYRLAKGETIGDVIVKTGGTTPQANLRRARIERKINGNTDVISVDLEALIMRQDKKADVVLKSGDTVILPALVESVYVFGQAGRPGSYSFEPDRKMLDYLGLAGGPTVKAKPNAYVVREEDGKTTTLKVNIKGGFQGTSKDNPVIKPGDVIYIPSSVITDWRDISQVISTVRLLTGF